MLSIQKHILLLNDFYFNELVDYLRFSRADLSYKLVNEIRNFGWEQPDSDVLCQRIYGKKDEKSKKNFLQLAHHTFKLTGYISRNFPYFLQQNLLHIQDLINRGNKKRALLIGDCLLDIAGKVEDFTTQCNVLKFLGQHSYLIEEKDSAGFQTEILKTLHYEKELNEVYFYLRDNLHHRKKENLALEKKNQAGKFIAPYLKSESQSVNLLARFVRLYEMMFLNLPEFYSETSFKELESIEKDLHNNSFLVFHFMDDVLFKVLGLKLQYMVNKMDAQGMMKESQKIIEASQHLKFWKSYVNVPELFAIAIQASHFISHYGDTYRTDHYKNLPEDVKQQVNYLKENLLNELNKDIWNEGYIVKQINTRSLYCGLLLLGTEADKQKSIDFMEETLITFQQISFQKFLDGMFASLVIGYFSLKKYEKVAETYKRYKKVTSGNLVLEENDLTICAYYYTAQWLTTGRKQYQEKLKQCRDAAMAKANLNHVVMLIKGLSDYFKIPL